MAQINLLLVEDDPSFGSVLRDYLSLNNYSVTYAKDGEEGINKFKKGEYHLCILDVMMPKKDGFTLAQEIKEINPLMPIIFLTARSLKEDILKGYKSGACDYLTKPFDTEVLLYKIKAILEQNVLVNSVLGGDKKDVHLFKIGNFYFDSKIRLLKIRDQEFILSHKESELLKLLCLHINDLVPRELTLNKIWHEDNYFNSRSMDVYIARLRKHLKHDPNVEIINVHGYGFRLLDNTTYL